MRTFAIVNKRGQEVIFNSYSDPFQYLENVLKLENQGYLPKDLYSSEKTVEHEEEWCNGYTNGHFSVPTLRDYVIVPKGTLKKLGLGEYKGIPLEIFDYDS